jgi:hypothetical protein
MKKQLGLAALGLAGLTAGAGAGLVLTGGSGNAAAQTTPDTSAPDTSASDSGAPDTNDDETRGPGTWLQDALAPLVEDGTLTQAQADAVIAAIEEARPERGKGPGPGGHGGFGRGRFNLEVVAEALGVTTEELRTQLRDGSTIAEVAEAEGVDIETVKAAMLDAFRTHEQEHVTSGRLTQDQADANVAAFEERLDELVTNQLPPRPDKDATDDGSDEADDDQETPATTTG